VVVPLWSCWRARCCPVLLPWTRSKNLPRYLPQTLDQSTCPENILRRISRYLRIPQKVSSAQPDDTIREPKPG
jgi:hypothetical protein